MHVQGVWSVQISSFGSLIKSFFFSLAAHELKKEKDEYVDAFSCRKLVS